MKNLPTLRCGWVWRLDDLFTSSFFGERRLLAIPHAGTPQDPAGPDGSNSLCSALLVAKVHYNSWYDFYSYQVQSVESSPHIGKSLPETK